VQAQLTDFERLILTSVVEGFNAREGLKDRMRALNEWEIARRSGFIELSYVEFMEHPSRQELMQALSTLQRQGLIGVWERGTKYDSYMPMAAGNELVESPATPSASPNGSVQAAGSDPPVDAEPGAVLARLDEIIRLLRSIDARLGGR